jgi:hypothetical protein
MREEMTGKHAPALHAPARHLAVVVLACIAACGYPSPEHSDAGLTTDGQAAAGDGKQHPTGDGGGSSTCMSGSASLAYTGASAPLAQPACVTQISVNVCGAGGGSSVPFAEPGPGGSGACIEASLAIAPGSTITVYVGGAGGNATNNAPGSGGFNGGGTGGLNGSYTGGGGGGASDVRLGGTGLADRVFVGAGGGGGGYCGSGGSAGELSGNEGATCDDLTAATGGTQDGGGGAGADPTMNYSNGAPGSLGAGGDGGPGGGGGGAGYYGGGGGCMSGGGGASSFADANATNVSESPNGNNLGAGSVVVSW